MKLDRLKARLRAVDDEEKQRRRQEQREHLRAIADAKGRIFFEPAPPHPGTGRIAAAALRLVREG